MSIKVVAGAGLLTLFEKDSKTWEFDSPNHHEKEAKKNGSVVDGE